MSIRSLILSTQTLKDTKAQLPMFMCCTFIAHGKSVRIKCATVKMCFCVLRFWDRSINRIIRIRCSLIFYIVINFHVSRFCLTVVPVACIVIGLHASPTVGCIKHVTTVITVLTPPNLTCVNQPNYGFNMAAVIAFQAMFNSCISFWIFILTFTRSLHCLSF